MKRKIALLLPIIMLFTTCSPLTLVKAASPPTVQYTTHVQTYGWQSLRKNGESAGTEGQSKRLEGIKISIADQDCSGDIQYRTHVQTYGWQDWTANGQMSGTSGQAKRLEAIQIQLTGDMANRYDIYYRVHAQNFGWMGWAKNGEAAGTAGYAYRLEAIQIKLVTKGGNAPGPTENHYKHPLVQYNVHCQTYGWLPTVSDGGESGTTGQGKRLEGIHISLNNQEYSGNIQYRTHVQTYGWQNWVSNGAMSGTSGESKRLESIQIQLTGQMAEHYDVYYRVHAQTYGWMGWAKNGEYAGTAGLGKRLESIQIVLVNKGTSAPGPTDGAYAEPCSHNWVEQTSVVHHDATGHNETKWVEDKAAWDEPTYGLKEVCICSACGADITGNESAHMEQHMLKGENGGYYTEWKTVQTGSIHHDATGHNEQVWVQDKPAWDETVTTGYKCSKCGATK